MRLTRRTFLRLGVRAGIVVTAGTLGTLGWARYVEPGWIAVEEVTVTLPRLPQAFNGFRIAQITDLHIECGDTAQQWPAIAEMTTRLGADIICLTGDYISRHRDNWSESVANGLRYLKAPEGVFAVMGNHDRADNCMQSRQALDKSGIRELRNEVHFLTRGAQRLCLAGVDDAQELSGNLPLIQKAIPAETCTVFLCHEPDFVDDVAPGRKIDLMLSGHAHGGQICFPFMGPLWLPYNGRKYWRGLNKVLDTYVYTSRGIGMVGLPIRLGARPEITLLTLKSGSVE